MEKHLVEVQFFLIGMKIFNEIPINTSDSES